MWFIFDGHQKNSCCPLFSLLSWNWQLLSFNSEHISKNNVIISNFEPLCGRQSKEYTLEILGHQETIQLNRHLFDRATNESHSFLYMHFRAILDNQSYVRLNLDLLFWCNFCESVEMLIVTMFIQKCLFTTGPFSHISPTSY